jgi:AAA15 family ATPase/GTPase
LNANRRSENAVFKYHFVFDKNIILYEYGKKTSVTLSYEKLYVNDKLILEYDYNNPAKFKCDIEGTENLVAGMHQSKLASDPHLSFIKYIYGNTPQTGKSIIKQLIDFVSGMLYFKNIIQGNQYAGYMLGGSDLSSIILNRGKLKDFQAFLGKMGINYELITQTSSITGMITICVKFDDKSVAELAQIASSGTMTLWLFYCWMLEFENLTFLIIDEFDAYYHYDLSTKVLETINSYKNYQSVITTHSTYLMDWEYTRPDCCYIISDNSAVKPICGLASKEIRESNNIEVMYKKNQFNGWD